MKIDSDEVEFIRKHIMKKKLHEVEKIFNKCNDNDCIQIILNHKDSYFPDSKSKEHLVNEIVKLIEVDDNKDLMEEAILRGIRRRL